MTPALLFTRRARLGAAIFCALICIAALRPPLLRADDAVRITVRCTGYAEGVGYAARERAINDARQRALMEVIQALVASEDLELFRPILREAASYVPGYELLRHDQIGTDTRVEIDAQVLEAPLHRDIATMMLPRLPEKPRVLLVIGEKIGDDPIVAVPDFGAAEVAFKKALEDKGIEVRGVDTLDGLYTHPQLMELVEGGVEKGAAFARENPAHVAVIGTAQSTYTQLREDVNMRENRARVRLGVFRGVDGKMVDEIVSEAVVHSADPFEGGEAAVQDACRKAQSQVITAAVIALLSAHASDALQVTVINPRTRERMEALMAALQREPGAGRPELLYFSPGLARLSLPFDGSLGALVDGIEWFTHDGAGIEVTRVLKRDVEITCE
jgi:hypothetical protein